MATSKNAQKYHDRMFPVYESQLAQTDPEFIELFDNFAFDEVVNQDDLDDKTRFMAILATLLGCQGIDEFKLMLTASYNLGVTPVEMKEIVYQATAYLGIGRTFPFILAVNDLCRDNGIALPLEQTGTTDPTNRIEKGNQAQVDIFGDHMKG
ncbi:MAG: carboxymuconolactone decarboxylase family protein, partial [Acetatifactor sp.]|nr:carboxymuconolactone decarboxylase family protein [Acetatifactor sp.]